jgi:hypothetical protein
VFDCAEWFDGAKVLHEQEFRERDTDPPGYRGGEALRRAELHAQHLEQFVWPGKYVEVDSIWEKS